MPGHRRGYWRNPISLARAHLTLRPPRPRVLSAFSMEDPVISHAGSGLNPPARTTPGVSSKTARVSEANRPAGALQSLLSRSFGTLALRPSLIRFPDARLHDPARNVMRPPRSPRASPGKKPRRRVASCRGKPEGWVGKRSQSLWSATPMRDTFSGVPDALGP